MKIITLCAIALTTGFFATSCNNSGSSSTSTTDTTATMSTAPAPAQNSNGTDTAMSNNANNTTTDTSATGNGDMNGSGKNMHEKVVTVIKHDNNADAKSVSAARTGNTNGIKSRMKADSVDNRAGFGAGK